MGSVNWLAKAIAVMVLALYGLASMHCALEGVPGFEFLKTCCFVDSSSSAPQDCEGDGCGPVEDGGYRAEEQTTPVPQPPLLLALLSPLLTPPLPESQVVAFRASESPPDLPGSWQFAHRTALPPRAPSFAS